jgi:polar amino acid transport system substrate-binding protein
MTCPRRNFIQGLRGLIMTAAAVAAAVLATGGPVSAQTLAEIQAKKKIVLGVLTDFPPFGIMNDQQQPDGLDIELAKLLAKNLGVEPEIVSMTTANRIPYLQSKRVDILVASLGITPERAKQVMFTIPYAAVNVVIAAPKSVNLKTIEDLKSISVAVSRGSSQETYVDAIAPKGAKIERFDGESPAAQAMLSGQADAWANNTVMIGAIAKANPSLQLEEKITLRRQANAIAVRLDAFELHQWINTFIYQIKLSGELDALNRKWIGVPLGDLPVF